MKLPQDFTDKMKRLLGEAEYQQFLKSYDLPRYHGIRINTLKISVEKFIELSPFKLEPVPWTIDGFYYDGSETPGRHPYYYAGLYYIQEPSAMLPGAVLSPKPGEKVLDLCAAPGGKTVQLAAAMKGKGLLFANDINSDRVKALVKNVELAGIKNVVVTNDTPEKLAKKLPMYFDRILVDAPCSGEGMFRKDEDAAKKWESFKCDKCCTMQRSILNRVDDMLKPGGYLLYSTCTFSPEEDELMIGEFLNNHPDYQMTDIPKTGGIENGRPEWAEGRQEMLKAARLWPHRLKGEGHFVALLQKKSKEILADYKKERGISGSKPEELEKFEHECLNVNIDGAFYIKGSNVYVLPEELPDLSGVKIAKFGWYLGEIGKRGFEPSHSMALGLTSKDIKKIINFEANDNNVSRYLKGETLLIEGCKGYTAVCVDGYNLGWAKQTGDMLKNLYPKGWRKMS